MPLCNKCGVFRPGLFDLVGQHGQVIGDGQEKHLRPHRERRQFARYLLDGEIQRVEPGYGRGGGRGYPLQFAVLQCQLPCLLCYLCPELPFLEGEPGFGLDIGFYCDGAFAELCIQGILGIGHQSKRHDILLYDNSQLPALLGHGREGLMTFLQQAFECLGRFVAQSLDPERHFIDLFGKVAVKFKCHIYGVFVHFPVSVLFPVSLRVGKEYVRLFFRCDLFCPACLFLHRSSAVEHHHYDRLPGHTVQYLVQRHVHAACYFMQRPKRAMGRAILIQGIFPVLVLR